MQHRRVLLASPVEPSGASWLLNCFLELGIRIDHKPVVDRVWRGSLPRPAADGIWMALDGNRVALHPKAGVLKKFLPALTRRPEFRFRDDISVGYVQDLPARQLLGQIDEPLRVLVVRDPRDAIYSSYRRGAPALTFSAFLDFPNAATLLGRSAHWALHIAAWLDLPKVHVVRFEDYKRDAQATLAAVLAALDLPYTGHEMSEAARLSSFEQARAAERRVQSQFPHDRQIANRSGTIGEGRQHPEIRASIAAIEGPTATMLRALGYAAPAPTADAFAAARLSAAFLAYFETVHTPAAVTSMPLDMVASREVLFATLGFAHRLDIEFLRRANMAPAEARTLLDSLTEFTQRHAAWLVDHAQRTRAEVSDGSGYFFDRIKEMRHAGRHGLPSSSESSGSPEQAINPVREDSDFQ